MQSSLIQQALLVNKSSCERTEYILETKHKLYLEYFWKKSYVLQFLAQVKHWDYPLI